MPPTIDDFAAELEDVLREARLRGDRTVEVRAGDLHERVGDYPGRSHRMPVCCSAMRNRMRSGDVIVRQPPKGNGATLVIRYRL